MRRVSIFFIALAGAFACSSRQGGVGAAASGAAASSSFASSGAGATGGGPTTGTGGAGGASAATSFSASLSSRTFLCKLLNNAFLEDPTANQVQARFNLKGADLGVPVVVGSALHLFFGDTMGYKVIWPPGQDPDSVAQIPFASVVADPKSLCSGLAFYVTPDQPSVAHGTDPSIQRDFAGAWMAPPPGQAIGQYIAQPAGPFPNMPGTFEVPTGGLSRNGKAFLFYAGLVEKTPATRATLGYLARWDAPGATVPDYQILRPIDALANGALGGHFIQVAPVDHGGQVYLFGTGNYRHSGVHLARIGSAALETGGGEALFDPQGPAWKDAAALSQGEREGVAPLFEADGVGELSVQRIDAAGLFVALYQRQLYDGMGHIDDNRVILRVAPAPEGPWSDALTIVDMADPAFQSAHCCGQTCPGGQILHCDRAGLYGAYLLPSAAATPAGSGAFDLTLPFLVSTWDPYDVVAFTAGVHVAPKP